MTPLEDTLRDALRAKGSEVPSSYRPPPLRLSGRRTRLLSLIHGGDERQEAPARPRWLAPAFSACLVIALIAGSVALSQFLPAGQTPGQGSSGGTAVARNRTAVNGAAATWVRTQVSRNAIVSCDPAMCAVLKGHGVPARDLLPLRAGGPGLRASALVVATAAVRREFGRRLSSYYAPETIASFGSGSARVDIQVIAPDGAAAYKAALRADLRARKAAGRRLLSTNGVTASANARGQLLSGQADSRILVTIDAMASRTAVYIVAFTDCGSSGTTSGPLRCVTLEAAKETSGDRRAALQQMIGFLEHQRSPYLAGHTEITRLADEQDVLRVEFPAPAPLGLLGPAPSGRQ